MYCSITPALCSSAKNAAASDSAAASGAISRIARLQASGIRSRIAAICWRSEEHTSELQSLMRISYAVFCLKKKTHKKPLYSQYVKRKQQQKHPCTTTNSIHQQRSQETTI